MRRISKYLREKRRFELEGGSEDDLEKIKGREFHLFEQSDIVTTVNPEEAEMIREAVPGKEVMVIHHPIDRITHMTTPFNERRDLLFVGSSHAPNTDAVIFFAGEILPLLKKEIPDIKLYVVGGNPDRKLKEIESPNIILTGFVKDLLPYFEKCRVYCAPLRYGAGVKGKVIEAMSFGLPIVTTPVGAEGLGVSNDDHMLVADNAEGLADCVMKLYNDALLWDRISGQSKIYVEQYFSQEAYREKIKVLMERIFA